MGCASSKSVVVEEPKTRKDVEKPFEFPTQPAEVVSEKIHTPAENGTKSPLSIPPSPSPLSPQSSITLSAPTSPLLTAISDPSALHQITQSQDNSHDEYPTLKPFSLNELKEGTGGFSGDNLLGQGGFGKVYKGILQSNGGTEKLKVAVKRLRRDSNQGQQEWLAEILILGRLSHPNLVKLYGYCTEEGEGILVYDYLPLGSLNYHLFPDNSPSKLSWETRLKIAYGTASALAYLHDNRIIHRDFKASNILLDAKFTPILTDFGLAKILPPEATHTSTRIMGTLGYIDPKFCETGQLTTKSDVYAFGVLLLELISGKKAKEDDVAITDWASPYLSQRDIDIDKLFDPSLIPSISSKHMHRIGQKLTVIAKYCVEVDPAMRPTMNEVMKIFTPLMKKFNDLTLDEASRPRSNAEEANGH